MKKKFKFSINGNQYEVQINHIENTEADVEVNGLKYKVILESNLQQASTPKLATSLPVTEIEQKPMPAKPKEENKGSGYIKTPLPGTIIDVFVRVGDTVKVGQRLAILEAMKMENNIESDRDGKVIEVRVSKNDIVAEGDILVVIE